MFRLDRGLSILWLAVSGLGVVPQDTPDAPRPEAGSRWPRALEPRAEWLDPKACRIGQRVADVELAYLDGTRGTLAENLGPEGLIVFVRGAECPVSRRYGNETARIEREFLPRGVASLFVDMEDPSAPEAVREELDAFGFQGRYALDPEQRLGLELGATRTTEAFLLDSARTLVYRGAIDDQYDRGCSRAEPSARYLRDALRAMLDDENVPVEATRAPGCVLPPRAATRSAVERPTYHREVSRILQRNCVECHRAGGAGPFALDGLGAVRRKRATIRAVVEDGSMPPWSAAHGTGPFVDERRLSEEERATLLAWIAAGAPEGDPAEAPRPRSWNDGWRIGEPDLVLSMPRSFAVPPEGAVELQHFEPTEPTQGDLWVERIQVLPAAPRVVHHVSIRILAPGKSEDHFYGYLPGCEPLVYRGSVARFVPKGTRFRFTVHYTPDGVATSDRTRMGFVLAREPPDLTVLSQARGKKELFIPARAREVSFTDTYELPARILLRSLTPHMHLRGKAFRVEAFAPDGTREVLLQLDDWDPDWQYTYEFRAWRDLPRGTKLVTTAWYDNSAANPRNPDPSADVRNGPQTTTDEMMFLGLEWVRPNRRTRPGPAAEREAVESLHSPTSR